MCLGVLSNRKIWPYLTFFGWLSPLPLVIITVSIKQDAYSSHNAGYCWISNEDGVIWAFLGPVFLVLILNTIILVTSAIRIGTARKNLDKMKQMRVALISAFILTPVLGMPWLVSFAKIITVGIEDELTLAILDRFIDWVFICLNAPAGVVFFIIILKRFLENRKSSQKSKSGSSMITASTSQAVDLSKFKKPIKSTVSQMSFEQTTSITGYRICKTNSNASGISSSMGGTHGNRKELLSNRESLFEDQNHLGIYSTLDTNFMDSYNKCTSSPRQSTKLTNSVYEVASMEDLSKMPSSASEDIPLEVIRRKMSISCQLPIDEQFTLVDENVKLTASDDDDNKNASILSRGIDFIKSSIRKSKREELTDTEANPSPTPSSTNSDSATKYQNIYMEHLNKLNEKTQSNPEIAAIPGEDKTEETVGLRKKSAPTSSRLSCQHAVRVKDLKQYFDVTTDSVSKNPYTSITESDDENNPDKENGKEESRNVIQSATGNDDDVFNAVSSFKMELASDQPREKKSADLSTIGKTKSLDAEVILPMHHRSTDALGPREHTSSVSQRVRCYEDIIETNTVQTIPKRAQSVGLTNRIHIDPTTQEQVDSDIPRSSSLSGLNDSDPEENKQESVDGQESNV